MLKTEILRLRTQGKTYDEISKELKCSKSIISYHCNDKVKIKQSVRQKRNRKKFHPFQSKIYHYIWKKKKTKVSKIVNRRFQQLIQWKINFFKGDDMTTSFSVSDVINKFGENLKCALTGDAIDITHPRTYHFDHKIPTSRGGDNSLENLQILSRQANLAKSDLTNDEFLHLCKRILENSGYEVVKK